MPEQITIYKPWLELPSPSNDWIPAQQFHQLNEAAHEKRTKTLT
jgi:hypothetical protein